MAVSESHALAADHNEEQRYQLVQEQRSVPLQKSSAILFAALGDESWRVRKQAVEVLLAACPDQVVLHQLIDLLRDEENAGLRNATAELLVRCGSRVVPILLGYLDDADHDLRKLVVDALGALGGDEALRGLSRALSDPDNNVAAAAAEAFGVAGNEQAVPELLRHLEQNREPFFRFNVLAALGRIGVPGPLPPVVKQLAGQDMLRRAVFECLGKIGADVEAVELLLEGVLSHLPSIRQAAIISLAQVLQHLDNQQLSEVRNRLQQLADQGLTDQLAVAASAKNLPLRTAVLAILKLLAAPRTIPVLFTLFADERLATEAESVLVQLGPAALQAAVTRFADAAAAEKAGLCRFIGNQAAGEGAGIVRSGLADLDARVRAAATYAAGRLRDPELVKLVSNLLHDEDNTVREAALAALHRSADSDHPLVTAIAGQLSAADDAAQRRDAVQLYAALMDAEGLARLLKDEEATVREAAARAAGKLKSVDVCSHLMMALVDEDADVRIAAAEALGDCQDSGAVAPLRLSIKDSDPWVQAAALRSLVQLSGEEALPDLLKLWESEEEVVQLACLESFDLIATPAALQAAARDLGRRDGEVLKGVISLLHNHDPALLSPWFNHILCHQDWDVRITAVRASGALPESERVPVLQMVLDREENELVRAELRVMLGMV